MATLTSTLTDLYLLDFYSRKTGILELINLTEYQLLQETYEKNCPNLEPHNFILRNINNIALDTLLEKVLSLGNGKISLCGLGLTRSIIFCEPEEYASPTYYDLFIHSCDLDEANSLITQCMDFFRNAVYKKVDNKILLCLDSYIIRFSLEVYENIEQVLKYNYSPLEKHSWDPVNKYIGTIVCIISAILEIVPLEVEEELYNLNADEIITAFDNIEVDIISSNVLHKVGYIFGYECISVPRIIDRFDSWDDLVPRIEISRFTQKLSPKPNINKYIENYKYTLVGISDDRYAAFSSIRKKYNIEDGGLFTYMCSHWFEAEYIITKRKLLGTSD